MVGRGSSPDAARVGVQFFGVALANKRSAGTLVTAPRETETSDIRFGSKGGMAACPR